MIWAILVLALALRLIALNQSLWLDEAINVLSAKNLDFLSFVWKYPVGDFHPPGYFVLLWVWTHAFGFSEIAVRLPSVILGVATVCLTYLLGKRLFDGKVALLGALFLTVGPLHVYYSQEARMYSLAAFGVTASFYFLVGLVEKKNWSKVGFFLSTVLVLYSDYVAYFIVPAQLLFLVLYERKSFKAVLALWGAGLVVLLPWLPVFEKQLLTGNGAAASSLVWKEVVGGATFKNLALVFLKTVFGRVSLDNKPLYTMSGTAVGGIYSTLFYFAARKISRQVVLLLFWLVGPVILAFTVSFFVPVFSYFRLVFILPALYLILAYGLSNLPGVFARPVTVCLVGISVVMLAFYYTNPQFQREDWRGAVAFVESKTDEKSAVLFESNSQFPPYIFYRQSLKAQLSAMPSSFAYSRGSPNEMAGLVRIPAESERDIQNLSVLLQDKNKVYLFEYLVEITDQGRFLEKGLKNLGFKKSQVYDFTGVGFVTLYKRL